MLEDWRRGLFKVSGGICRDSHRGCDQLTMRFGGLKNPSVAVMLSSFHIF